ncbi:MAG TPA: hypothetical protein VF307_08540 [Candidatus Nanopelagicaceae bacterium]
MEIEKPVEANVFLVDDDAGKFLAIARRKRRNRLILSFLLVAVLVSTASFFAANYFIKDKTLSPVNRLLALKGGVDLNAQQLRDLVVSEGLIAYWAGPQLGARYALTALADGEIYIRYLPDGKGLADARAAYRVIGTYYEKGAFANVQTSGKQLNSVGFTNQDGDAVFYNKLRPTNLYIGLKNLNVEVEVYDPDSIAALVVASGPSIIRKIS